MEEQIKFRKSQGRGKKRYVSSVNIEATFASNFHAWPGDTLTLTADDKDADRHMSVTIIFAETVDWKPGDKIKLKSELVPSLTTVIFEKVQ